MEELQYVPSRAASSLRSGTSNILGLLVPDIGNSWFAEMAKGVEDAANDRGYGVLLGNTNFQEERSERYLDMIRSRLVDALVYAGSTPSPTSSLHWLSRDFPIGLADEELDDVQAITVVGNNEQGGALAAEHLNALHHRSALLITGPAGLRSSTDREKGFRGAFKGDIEVIEGDFNHTSGIDAIRRSIDVGLEYSAVFALNDMMAAGAMKQLWVMGRSIPDDVSVVGFDDSTLANLVTPTLTTVRQDAYQIGWTVASELLASLVSNETADTRTIRMDVELRIRDSSGPAPA